MNNRLIPCLLAVLLLPQLVVGGPPEKETQIVPLLGVATTETTPNRRSRAGLPQGVGLTVQYVLPNSPAETAGLKRFDVLHRLDDQILVNDPQFRVLIRIHKPGDEIKLTLLRQGKPLQVPVVLGEREIPLTEGPPGEPLPWLLKPAQGARPPAGRVGFSASYEDDEHLLILRTDEHGKHLLATDRRDAVLFDGPVNTAAQRRAVPDAVRLKLKRLETPPKRSPL